MNIAIVTTGHRPDDDRIFFKEVASLLTKYPRIDLIAPTEPGETYALAPGVALHPIPRRGGIAGRLLTAFRAARAVIRLDPDICHFHDLDFILMVPFVRLLSQAKLIYDVHELYPERMLISNKIPRWSRRPAARLVDVFEKAIARWCALVVAAVDPIAERFRSAGVSAITVFNYPRLSLFAARAPVDERLRQAYAGRRVLIYQGTMGRDRGLFHMLAGMRLLKEKAPEALLLLVGLNDPGLRAQADDQIRRERLENVVQIVPWVPHAEIAGYMALAEIGLVPLQPSEKNKKSLPIKVFEYMACGIPLLAADLPSVVPYIVESGAGVIYDSTAAEAFAREAQRLLANRAGREAMAKAGREAVAARWNWGEMEKRLLAAYAKLEAK